MEQSSYDILVEKILRVPALKKYVNKENAKGNFLNLVDPEWKKRLENYCVYQRHLNRPDGSLFRPPSEMNYCESQFVKSNDDKFHLMLALSCRVCNIYETSKRAFSLYSMESEPLLLVAQAMSRDKKKTHKVIDEYKFYTDPCKPSDCSPCKNMLTKIKNHGYTITEENPCIRSTRLFDGEDIVVRFGSHIKNTFASKEFLTIALVEINNRSMYNRKENNTDVVRINGRMVQLLAFDSNRLDIDDEPLTMGNLDFLVQPAMNNAIDENESNKDSKDNSCLLTDLKLEFKNDEQPKEDSWKRKMEENDESDDDFKQADKILEAIPDNFVDKSDSKKKKKRKIEVTEDMFNME